MTRGKKRKKGAKYGVKEPTPPKYQLSQSMLAKLAATERATASADLWAKSMGVCALCSLPLDLSQKNSIVPDHRIPIAKDGETTLSNLYLAHRICNASRQHLDFDIAVRLTSFRSRAEQNHPINFDFVLDNFVVGPTRELITIERPAPHVIEVSFGHKAVRAQISVDPATQVEYFFVEVPVQHILNDEDIQPRPIIATHVRKLALDFLQRPVHEPSNCRLVQMSGAKTGHLLQFDGQHKTTAQILLGRHTVPMKVYVSPSIDMLQSLVIKIQQEIKKQPLTRSETLAKIGDVMKRHLDAYVEKDGKPRTEKGLIAAQPHGERQNVKKLYFDELKRMIFFDDENELSEAVSPGESGAPTTDKVVINKIIEPLLCRQLLEEDLDASVGRDEERKNILSIVNAIAEEVLPSGWKAPSKNFGRIRAENFFYQGSIGWWMTEILEPALRYVLYKIGNDKPLLIDPLDEKQREAILNLVETLCNWPIWSTQDPNHLKAMRSNTIKNVIEAFPEYNQQKLLKESKGSKS